MSKITVKQARQRLELLEHPKAPVKEVLFDFIDCYDEDVSDFTKKLMISTLIAKYKRIIRDNPGNPSQGKLFVAK